MAILRDVRDSLESWLGDALPAGTALRFAAPDPDWARASDHAFINFFLYDIRRDDRSPRSSGWTDVRDDEGKLIGRQPAVAYYRLSYLVAAWPKSTDSADDGAETSTAPAEYEFLSALLDVCASTEVIRAEHLTGSLADAGSPPTIVRCGGDPVDHATSLLWSGFGIAPRTHLVLEVVAPLVPPMLADLAPPVREIVLGARQLPSSGPPALNVGRSAGISPRARRWERRTIDETETETENVNPPPPSRSS